jgi:hypothetical protein
MDADEVRDAGLAARFAACPGARIEDSLTPAERVEGGRMRGGRAFAVARSKGHEQTDDGNRQDGAAERADHQPKLLVREPHWHHFHPMNFARSRLVKPP